MNKLFYILFIHCFFIFHVSGQSIFPKIEEAFQRLDSTLYIDKAFMKECKSGWPAERVNWCYEWNKNRTKNTRAVFLLNIDIDSTLVDSGNYIKLDTCEYNFTLLFVDKKTRIKYSLCFVNNKYYPFFIEFTGYVYGKKFADGYKKIIKRNPRYILKCFRLYYTILYIAEGPEDKILVYNIWDGKTYELEEYLEKIRNTEESAPGSHHYKYREGPLEEISEW